MPFTISHAVIAPPLSKLSGNRLPIAGLAIGSMTPDLYRLFTVHEFTISHQWQGLFFPNLFIGLGFCLLWYLLYRPLFLRFLNLNKPLNLISLQQKVTFFVYLNISILIGIATHLIWDGLTHVDFRTFAFRDFLSQTIMIYQHQYPLHKVLQIGSSIIVLPIMLWMMVHYYQKYRSSFNANKPTQYFTYLILFISIFVGLYKYISFAQGLGAAPWNADLYSFIGRSVNQFAQGFLMSFTFGCLIYRVLIYLNLIFDE